MDNLSAELQQAVNAECPRTPCVAPSKISGLRTRLEVFYRVQEEEGRRGSTSHKSRSETPAIS